MLRQVHLFQGYDGKVEKEAMIKQAESKYQTQLDSLEVELKSFAGLDLENDIELQKSYRAKVDYYNNIKQEVSYKMGDNREKYSDELWKQINQYVSDFGDQYDYDVILGALGNGSLMYGKEHVDITEEVLTYINKRYQGDE